MTLFSFLGCAHSCKSLSQSASEDLRAGKLLMSKNNPTEAIKVFDQGISKISYECCAEGVDDDTSVKYILAKSQLKDKNLEVSANLFKSVLESRLKNYSAACESKK
jgi:hypothetical protein